MRVRGFLLSVIAVLCLIFSSRAQTAGEVMFVGFNADGNDGFAFLTLVPLPTGTTIHFSDNEWNGSAIGGGGAFNDLTEGEMTWLNNTGNSISAGTIIVINNSSTTPAATLGTVSSGTIALGAGNEVLYMFLGADSSTPSLFLSAIANDGFSAGNGQLTNTGLTSGTNATSITGDEDVMVYTGSTQCTTTIANCAAAIANSANWSTEDGGGNQSNNGGIDFPASVDVNFYGTVFQRVTYYSRNATSGGNWDDPNSWTTISDGSGGPLGTGIWPASTDNVVILGGHSIVVNSVTDNQASGVSPNSLGRSNVGAFTGSGDLMFYQTGDILVANGGTLTVSEEFMIEGYTSIENGGTLSVTEDIVNLGFLEISTSGNFGNTDDLIISGNSITTIDNLSLGADDIYIDHTDARLCGDGTMNLGNGGADPTVQFFNGASLNQICSSFTVTCTSNCAAFPITPTGNFIVGNAGPGGVGNAANNQLWLRANTSVFVDGGVTAATNNQLVQQWNDQSGNARNAVEAINTPTFLENIINGFPAIRFDNSDRLLAANVTTGNSASVYVIARYSSLPSTNPGLVQGSPSGQAFSTAGNNKSVGMWVSSGGNPWGRGVQSNNSIVNISQVTAMPVSTFRSILNLYDATALQVGQYIDNVISGSVAYNGTLKSWTDFGIGRQGSETWNGDISEVIAYNAAVNQAQRIIISNYLSAKYLTSLTVGDDVYLMDSPANGNYDYEVAGIGQASDGSNHRDARGSGVVRMWNPDNLGNGEFLLWGHDNTALTSSVSTVGTAVDGTIIEERLQRVWRVSEVGDVGSASVSINYNGLTGSPLGSNLRLLIDRDGDGFADNDVTPISGSSSNGIVTFSNVNFQNGDRFTLGNTDLTRPLPVELIAFSAVPSRREIVIEWTTASELNNDFFTVQRSLDAEEWQAVLKVIGAGTLATPKSYQAVDLQPYHGDSYYRLMQTDYDGTVSFSNIERVYFEGIPSLAVHPNPSSGVFVLNGASAYSELRIYNDVGQIVSPSISRGADEIVIDLQTYPRGVYILRVSDGQSLQSLRIVKH
ncbi:MAG: T9SS type A sorting domain-containing protein [Cyclobacteriaceae bacterium]